MMRRSCTVISSLFMILVMMSTVCLAATIEGSGGQKRGYPGRNAELTGSVFTLPSSGTIVGVAGDGAAGFWIETSSGQLVVNFNSFAAANNFALSAGSYRIFPNLQNGRDSAWVRITVNCP